ncbi:hypothetical protein KAR91_21405 [Candidatus Pacearchaeota archaeon]|nr:hypothetical protein [Candidatus Pacearchaeota archaeon]
MGLHDRLSRKLVEAKVRNQKLKSQLSASDKRVKVLEVEKDKLLDALGEIADHSHCTIGHCSECGNGNPDPTYNTGIIQGHECAANIAKSALPVVAGEKEESPDDPKV